MILLDTSGMLAWIDQRQQRHAEVAALMATARGALILSPFVLAELDYFLAKRVGVVEQTLLLREVVEGAYWLAPFRSEDTARALEVMEKYGDLGVGLTDASIVVLAEIFGARDVLTLDERHFRVLRPKGDQPFRVLPSDA